MFLFVIFHNSMILYNAVKILINFMWSSNVNKSSIWQPKEDKILSRQMKKTAPLTQ